LVNPLEEKLSEIEETEEPQPKKKKSRLITVTHPREPNDIV
jgi:hypothetical protein